MSVYTPHSVAAARPPRALPPCTEAPPPVPCRVRHTRAGCPSIPSSPSAGQHNHTTFKIQITTLASVCKVGPPPKEKGGKALPTHLRAAAAHADTPHARPQRATGRISLVTAASTRTAAAGRPRYRREHDDHPSQRRLLVSPAGRGPGAGAGAGPGFGWGRGGRARDTVAQAAAPAADGRARRDTGGGDDGGGSAARAPASPARSRAAARVRGGVRQKRKFP